MKIFFIPVTIDSDIMNTETIGQHTGVERGSEKLKSYCAGTSIISFLIYLHTQNIYRCVHTSKMLHQRDDGSRRISRITQLRGCRYIMQPYENLWIKKSSNVLLLRCPTSKHSDCCGGGLCTARRGLMKADLKGVSYVGTTSGRPGQKDLMSAATFLPQSRARKKKEGRL